MTRRTDGNPSPASAARRALPLPARRAAACLSTLVAALALPGTAAAAGGALPWPSDGAGARAGEIRDAEVFTLRGALQQDRPGFWGGAQTTSTGETVVVYASNTYPQDPARTLAWAEYLVTLEHGAEVASLQLYVAPLAEVQGVCGSRALACYSPREDTIYAPGEAPDPETSAEAIVAHEYGHHIAANRSNAPWPAVDWGTKRWATYLSVCSRALEGELFPGDERGNYQLNPGEGFAEAYRALNEQRLGATPTIWSIVDRLFQPDSQALALVLQDVTQPWTEATRVTVTGRVTAKAPRSTRTFPTPLDGTVRVTLRVPAKSRLTLQLVDPQTGTVLARTAASAPYASTVQTTACGRRTLIARVTATKGTGVYRLSVARP